MKREGLPSSGSISKLVALTNAELIGAGCCQELLLLGTGSGIG